MFFVFGPSGQIASGAGDRLSQVKGVQRVRRPLALQPRRTDSAVQPASPYAQEHNSAPAPLTPTSAHVADAVAAYARASASPKRARRPLTRVSDVMTHGAVSVRPEQHLIDAWRALTQHQVGQAPVVNAQGRVVGLLLREHLMAPEQLATADGRVMVPALVATRSVAQVMVSPTPTVSASEDLRQVAGVLLAVGLPGLPVTDDHGQAVGFLSRTDILRAVAADPPLDLWG